MLDGKPNISERWVEVFGSFDLGATSWIIEWSFSISCTCGLIRPGYFCSYCNLKTKLVQTWILYKMLLSQIMVFFLFRLRTQLLCQTEEGHFPFDHQTCRLVMDNCKCSVFFTLLFITLLSHNKNCSSLLLVLW